MIFEILLMKILEKLLNNSCQIIDIRKAFSNGSRHKVRHSICRGGCKSIYGGLEIFSLEISEEDS
jgi:hypothetical protein